MKKERAYTSGRVCPISEELRGFSNVSVVAALSVVMLLGTTGWRVWQTVDTKTAEVSFIASTAPIQISKVAPNDASSIQTSDQMQPGTPETSSALGSAILNGLVSRYSALNDQGTYSPEVAENVAERMASEINPVIEHRTYTATDIKSDSNNSIERLQTYSDDLHIALAPMRKKGEPEFEVYAYYIETHDAKYLAQLHDSARSYRAAAAAAAALVVPTSAAVQHVGILNALEQFAATIDVLAENAADPYASVALLRNYNDAESTMYESFKALAQVFPQKNS